MKNNIDTIIESIHSGERHQLRIDFPDKYSDVSIADIYFDIHNEAKQIKTGIAIQPVQQPIATMAGVPGHIIWLKKLSRRLERIPLYKNILLPWVKRIIKHSITRPVYKVDGKRLLALDVDVFLHMAYLAILRREPSKEDMFNVQAQLIKGGSKLEIIQQLVNSPECEALSYKVVVESIAGIRFKMRLINRGSRIPVVGWLFRWARLAAQQPILEAYLGQNLLRERERENQLELQQALDRERDERARDDQNLLDREREKRARDDQNLVERFYVRYNEVIQKDRREEVQAREMMYLPYLDSWTQDYPRDITQMYDLGCGTCEWVEMLNNNGYPIIGVENNTLVVQKVHQQFPIIQIIQEDAYAFLESLPDSSVDFLSCFHMIEHIDFLYLLRFFRECHRVLRTGGMLLLETPNPQNILTATFYFYLDPTHLKPIPPELLVFYLEESGFEIKAKLLNSPLEYTSYNYKPNDALSDIIFRFNIEQAHGAVAVKI